ncbi:YetF domain-containing protein, partial [Bacillus cereus group sp. Bce025]
YPEYEAVSRLDLKVAGKKSPVSFVLVKDGSIQQDVLALLGKTEEWAREFLEKNAEVESILLATVDETHKINILLKK